MSDGKKRDEPACLPAPPEDMDPRGVSRRGFLKALGLGATAATLPEEGLIGAAVEEAKAEDGVGPGPVPVKLRLNARTYDLKLEPRTTLLDAMRNHLQDGRPEYVDLTGMKRVCDRGSCGACTVIIDGRTVYSCSTLAVAAQGKEIRTIEGLEKDGKLHPVQQAFIDKDGLMCGFCTPGFIMSSVALLESNPSPSRDEIRKALDGNICRCGTQCRVLESVEEAARVLKGGR